MAVVTRIAPWCDNPDNTLPDIGIGRRAVDVCECLNVLIARLACHLQAERHDATLERLAEVVALVTADRFGGSSGQYAQPVLDAITGCARETGYTSQDTKARALITATLAEAVSDASGLNPSDIIYATADEDWHAPSAPASA